MYSKFMRACNNMEIIVQTINGDEYSLNEEKLISQIIQWIISQGPSY